MRARVIISVFAAWTMGFQAFAGVAGGACRHAASAKSVATHAPQQQGHHAHHGAHQNQGQQTQKAGNPSLTGCSCGCPCAGDCLHACQLSAVVIATPKVPVAPVKDVPAVLAGHVLASHKLPLLRPPAALQA